MSSKCPKGSYEPEMSQKSLWTTRKKKVKLQGIQIEENSPRSDINQSLISPEVHVCVSPVHDKKQSILTSVER
jgi:hypothetical protein